MDGPNPGFLNRHLLRQGTRRTPVVALAIAVVSFDSGFGAGAGSNFRLLGEKEIRAAVVGNDITDGAHWSMYLRRDGALVGVESGSSWTGIWSVQSNKLCMTDPGAKTPSCYDVWISGANISLRMNRDDDAFVGVVEKHKAN
jgi:hypothetical protein